MTTVRKVYSDHLCCSCGTCGGVCPSDAITFEIDDEGFYKPKIDSDRCTDCGLCYTYCPGKEYFTETTHKGRLTFGHTNDKELRHASSSGGIVTEVVRQLILRKEVDFAVVVRTKEHSLEPDILITNDTKKITSSCTSKYCPVPTNKVIKELRKKEGTFVIVCLPCQAQALRKYAVSNKAFGKKAKYIFSLFCNHAPSFHATEYVLSNMRVKDPKKVYYRGEGWPGYFRVTGKEPVRVLSTQVWNSGLGKYFKHHRCLVCNDPFGEMADASFGDAWFLDKTEDNEGNTCVVTRSKDFQKFLDKLKVERIISMHRLEREMFEKGHKEILRARTQMLPVELPILSGMRKKVPLNPPKPHNTPSIKDRLRGMKHLMIERKNRFLGRQRKAWGIIFRRTAKHFEIIKD